MSCRKARKQLTVLFGVMILAVTVFIVLVNLNRLGTLYHIGIPYRERAALQDIVPVLIFLFLYAPLIVRADMDTRLTVPNVLRNILGGAAVGAFLFIAVFMLNAWSPRLDGTGFPAGSGGYLSVLIRGTACCAAAFALWMLAVTLINALISGSRFSAVLIYLFSALEAYYAAFWFLNNVVVLDSQYLILYRDGSFRPLKSSLLLIPYLAAAALALLFLGLLFSSCWSVVRNKEKEEPLSVTVMLLPGEITDQTRSLISFFKKGEMKAPENAERLLCVAGPGDITGIPASSLSFLSIRSLFGNIAVRNAAGSFEAQGFYVAPLRDIEEAEVLRQWRDKTVLLYMNGFNDALLDKAQQEEVVGFLSSMREKGWLISCVSRAGVFRTLVGKGRTELSMRLLETDFPYSWAERRELFAPDRMLSQTITDRVSRILEMVENAGKIADQGISRVIKGILTDARASDGDAAYFYSMLKLAECILHILFLRKISETGISRKKADRPSIGTVSEYAVQTVDDQTASGSKEIIEAARYLEAFAARGRVNHNIRGNRVTFRQMAGLMSQLRNRFVGHGVMVYSITPDCLLPLTRCVDWMLSVTAEQLSVYSDDVIRFEERGKLPAAIERDQKRYLFSGLIGGRYALYLDYAGGERYVCSAESAAVPAMIRLLTEWDGEVES